MWLTGLPHAVGWSLGGAARAGDALPRPPNCTHALLFGTPCAAPPPYMGAALRPCTIIASRCVPPGHALALSSHMPTDPLFEARLHLDSRLAGAGAGPFAGACAAACPAPCLQLQPNTAWLLLGSWCRTLLPGRQEECEEVEEPGVGPVSSPLGVRIEGPDRGALQAHFRECLRREWVLWLL